MKDFTHINETLSCVRESPRSTELLSPVDCFHYICTATISQLIESMNPSYSINISSVTSTAFILQPSPILLQSQRSQFVHRVKILNSSANRFELLNIISLYSTEKTNKYLLRTVYHHAQQSKQLGRPCRIYRPHVRQSSYNCRRLLGMAPSLNKVFGIFGKRAVLYPWHVVRHVH